MTGLSMKHEGLQFISIDMVDASMIQNQWQAHFMQIFPLNLSELPLIHSSDKEFFDENWRGDNYTTYGQFMEEHCKGWL